MTSLPNPQLTTKRFRIPCPHLLSTIFLKQTPTWHNPRSLYSTNLLSPLLPKPTLHSSKITPHSCSNKPTKTRCFQPQIRTSFWFQYAKIHFQWNLARLLTTPPTWPKSGWTVSLTRKMKPNRPMLSKLGQRIRQTSGREKKQKNRRKGWL